jgi:hypothetical protein
MCENGSEDIKKASEEALELADALEDTDGHCYAGVLKLSLESLPDRTHKSTLINPLSQVWHSRQNSHQPATNV